MGGGGHGGCERKIEVFVKIKQKKKWRGGRGGGGFGSGGQGGCERGIEVFGKIQKKNKNNFFFGGGGRVGGGGQDGCVRRIEVFVKIQKNIGGGGSGGSGRGGGSASGVRVDVNEELKFLRKFKKKMGGGVRGWGLG